MTRTRLTQCVALLLVAAGSTAPTSIRAQQRFSFTGDVGVGLGVGKGGEAFRERDFAAWHAAVGIRLRATDRWAAFGELVAMRNVINSYDAVCIINPRGGCILVYPQLRGFGVTLGAVFAPWRPLEFRVGAGPGKLTAEGTDVMALITQADVTLRLSRHSGLTYGMRGNEIGDYNGERLIRRLYFLGLRFQ